MKSKIIPTVFAKSREEFNRRFNKLVGVSKDIQIDFMDGHFVRAKSIEIQEVPNLKKYKNAFEAHLMAVHPEEYIHELKRKGFKKVIFHYEAASMKVAELAEKIKKYGMKAFLAVNPHTNINHIMGYVHVVDGIMFMGHNPGVEHMEFEPLVYNNIKELREFSNKIVIQVDGGVNPKTAKKLNELRVDILNVGSFVSDAREPKKAVKELEKA